MTHLLLTNLLIVLSLFFITFAVIKFIRKPWLLFVSILLILFSVVYFTIGYIGLTNIDYRLSIEYYHIIPIVQIVCSLAIILLNLLAILVGSFKSKQNK